MGTLSRYVLIDLQETCYTQVDCLIPGWWKTKEDALASIGGCREYQAARKLDFTETGEEYMQRILNFVGGG